VTATELQTRWGIVSALSFEETPGGLIRAVIAGPHASGTVYLYGAHVTDWTPIGQPPVLYTSSRSRFERGMPIRGGVPIVFPWFGPCAGGLAGPLHGFARISEWDVEDAQLRSDGAVELTMVLAPNAASRELGYDRFQLRFRVGLGSSLEMEMEVHNRSDEPLRFEEALHTYFSVADVRQIVLTGLEGTTCIDRTAASARRESQEPIRFTRETDQAHIDTPSTCELHDPEWDRTIVIEKTGSQTTVVWNPWIEKNRNLADMAPDDWQTMCCVETANALENAVVLPPGGVHKMGATIRIAPCAALNETSS
jgi:glucose-6-phosphate 1-epimerase